MRQASGDIIELFVCLNSSYTAARAIELGLRLRGELGVNYLTANSRMAICSCRNSRGWE